MFKFLTSKKKLFFATTLIAGGTSGILYYFLDRNNKENTIKKIMNYSKAKNLNLKKEKLLELVNLLLANLLKAYH